MVIIMLPSRPERTPPCQPNFHAMTTLGRNTIINSRRSISGDSTICADADNKNRLHQMINEVRKGGLLVSSPSRW